MKAVFINEYGDSGKLIVGELDKPSILPSQVLVKIVASGVNPVDFHVRNGLLKDTGSHSMPLIPGWDAAGIIDAVGADVTSWKVGDEVFTFTPIMGQGNYAEYSAVEADFVTAKPKTLNFVESAAVPLAALTAWQGLFDHGGLKKGQRVLVHGASGGVGGFAVQMAKDAGAYVIGTASAKNEAYVRGLGVDEFIDYQKVPFEGVVEPVHLAFATVGGNNILNRSETIILDGGSLVSTFDDLDEGEILDRGISFSRMMVTQNRDQLSHIADLIDAGKITVAVDSVYPLDHAVQAHLRSESARAVGKIVLNINPSLNRKAA
ncbi:MAG: NADP-dependent oxidoreductase [Sneathiella sp.]